MCDFGKAFRRALDIDVEPPSTRDATPAGLDSTKDEISKSLKSLVDAQAAEAVATDPGGAKVVDAARRRRMRLTEPGSIGSFFTGVASRAGAATRTLFGQ